MKKILVILYLFIQNSFVFAAQTDTAKISQHDARYLTNQYFLELEDPNNTLTINDVIHNDSFHTTESTLPFLKYSKSVTWLKIIFKNNSNGVYLPITIGKSIIDEFDVYFESAPNQVTHLSSLDKQFNKDFSAKTITFINLPVSPKSTRTVFIRIKSNVAAIVPIEVHSVDEFAEETDIGNIINGGVMGVFLIMALYNLMLFLTVKDRSYLFYVNYIVFLGLSQILLMGYGNVMFSNDKVILNNYVFPVIRVFFGYSILLFAGEFLQLKINLNKYYQLYLFLFVLYTLPLIAAICGGTGIAFALITMCAFLTSISLLVIGVYLYIKGYNPAKFFLIGWGLSLVAIMLSVARNKGFVPYNGLTANIVVYSGVIELILFSVALADKINFYRHQKDESQQASLTIAKENERLITEQNILLENKVKERTQELIETNQNLSVTIENLKSAQSQLIETEKMASLGQLTAGVAHEINNPINFVSANVAPLKLDFDEIFMLLNKYEAALGELDKPELVAQALKYKDKIDLDFVKDEILTLLNGIEDGANRTSEIVQSLRTFGRMDELVLKPANINTAIINTLILLRSSIPYYIEVKPVLDKLEPLNCYSGKINQVLINLVSNSIQAIKAKEYHGNESVIITTRDYPDYIEIEVTDTGVGMSADTRQRIFEPFYTTKEVGEGTGLGLSIVFGIIEKHEGAIDVQSTLGVGTTFTVSLPKNLQSDND